MRIVKISYAPDDISRKHVYRIELEEKYGNFKLVYSFKHSQKTTNSFKNIFGSVVNKVFILESDEPTGNIRYNDNEIRWNNMQLVVLFNNGKYVHMANSLHANFEMLS